MWATPQYEHALSVVTVPPTLEPLTVEDGKLRAGLSWVSPDPRDDLMTGFIKAARARVEHDAERSLFTQTRTIYLDAVCGPVLTLPAQSSPLQEVVSIVTVDPSGAETVMDPASYVVDLVGARIAFSTFPTNLRRFQPWRITIVAGWDTVDAFIAEAPKLYQAVGVLVAFYATVGRDLAIVGTIVTEVPNGYDELIAEYRSVTLA